MTQPDTLHDRLAVELERRLAVARAAEGTWRVDVAGPIADIGWLGKSHDALTATWTQAKHIALHDPADAVRRYEGELQVLERHAPGYPLGQIEHRWHLERTESGRHVQVRDEEPVAPYYCERCDDFHPCPEILSLAHRLGVSVDG